MIVTLVILVLIAYTARYILASCYWHQTNGRVVGITPSNVGDLPGKSKKIFYRYRNLDYESNIGRSYSWDRYSVGDKIEIFVNPKNPNKIEEKNVFAGLLFPLFVILLTIAGWLSQTPIFH